MRGRKYNPDMHGQIAANWVDVFAEVVTAPEAPTQWPERLAIDSVGFITGNQALVRAGMGFNLLVGVGYEAI